MARMAITLRAGSASAELMVMSKASSSPVLATSRAGAVSAMSALGASAGAGGWISIAGATATEACWLSKNCS